MIRRFAILAVAVAAIAGGQLCARAYAQDPSAHAPEDSAGQDPVTGADSSTGGSGHRADNWLLNDIEDYYTAPLHWSAQNWEYFGGTLAAIAVAHAFDARVRRDVTGDSAVISKNPDSYDLQDALPAAALLGGTWFYSIAFHDENARSVTWAMAEAAGLSTATAYAFKFAAGREAPDQTTNPNLWGAGGSAFPSLHATAAWAVGTVFAESGSGNFRWITRLIGYGAAIATSYERIHHDAHWLSDVVAGAGLGASSGVFVVHRAYGGDDIESQAARVGFTPIAGGAMITYSATPYR